MKVAAGVIGVALFATGCARESRAVPCARLSGQAEPIMADRRHLPHAAAPHAPYASVPATSGPHVAFTIAPGLYREPIAEEIQVHALEHGHVLIQYASSLPERDVRVVEEFARRFPRRVIVAPYVRLDHGIVLSAWGRSERLRRVDADRVERFVRDLAGRYEHGWKGGATACSR